MTRKLPSISEHPAVVLYCFARRYWVHLFLLDRFLGGNQREQDRLKAQKKAAAQQKKPKESATNLTKRKEAYVSFVCFLKLPAPDRVTPQGRRDSASQAAGGKQSSFRFVYLNCVDIQKNAEAKSAAESSAAPSGGTKS